MAKKEKLWRRGKNSGNIVVSISMNVIRHPGMVCIILLLTSCVHPPVPVRQEKPEPLPEVSGGNGEEIKEEEIVPRQDPPPPEPEEPPAEPFVKAEIDARIINLVYPGTRPVTKGNELLAVYEDLDGNGYLDACVLCVEDQDPGRATFEVLSDDSRLYLEVLQPFTCSIQFFLQKNGKLYRSGIARLGRKLVLESFTELRLGDDSSLPAGAAAQFKTRGGSVREWALFLPEGISRFTIYESLSIIPVIDDIDGDGVIDVVVHHQGFEEGSGYETFMIWYKWNGNGFVEHRSTNIVRNLNAYLDKAAEFLTAGEWEAFIHKALSPAEEDRFREAGLSFYRMLPYIFDCGLESDESPFKDTSQPVEFIQVVFPDFYETPFSREDVNRFNIPLQVRLVTGDHDVYLCSAVIYMKRNPFQEEQFGFVPHH